ncbi:het domain protein [Colletotrichum asianum]|uniref:Het domain protein n=1 Tax=Colletotrichum asianum TaxID=702518 RepID=A0A8H3WAJ1_9PEZI|nr:het domain protein [Colletotrichum asianum]
MKLIDVRTLKIEEVFDEEIPNYVILSHTWDEEEVSFQDFQDIDVAQNMKGFEKIEEICRLARARGVDYAWVDTCCIDKTSSADLSESINSMFRYYHDAQACYAYLADMPRTRSLEKHLRNCRWFTRGWTLQELLAPAEVRFYDQDWNLLGTKESLVEIISDITGILCDVLLGKTPLWDIPVATRMAWAATRSTRRKEDVAYSLLGIFDINMPMLYGEGPKAFRRLQEEICRKDDDTSLLAWDSRRPLHSRTSVAFASSPADFAGHEKTQAIARFRNYDIGMELTSRGPRFMGRNLCMVVIPSEKDIQRPCPHGILGLAIAPKPILLPEEDNGGIIRYVLRLDIGTSTHRCGIFLEKVQPDLFRRDCNLPLALMSYKLDHLTEYQPSFIIVEDQLSYRRPDSTLWGRHKSVQVPIDKRIKISRILPRTSWDICSRLLFAPRFSTQVQALKLVVHLQPTQLELWMLCDRRHIQSSGRPRILLLDASPSRSDTTDIGIQAFLRHINREEEEDHWHAMISEGFKPDSFDDSITAGLGTQRYRISALVDVRTVKLKGYDVKEFSMRFNIRHI